ncbi:flavodoxin family protein [Streptomyces griseiscabiei]|uniref:NAD(P)H-dependent oxidoreductase n=1 Tax=Streptomyces griseiscabiei TaxID=2993540 RepID=A0ABU4LEP4_9ACTN|nr:NAD(P)H-dependent oxidoreductase [Streptomyces griseiscabiei]MBZ3907289.1 NAD(P)H-dependent oxidoreductase [Streptomyces griseiscabiei]MDX2914209.1 NAD(P)H-dependent oxidoreductase [Streptomyces griseiscabiei]
MTRRFLFVLGSSRPDGNSEMLARAAAEQLPGDVERRWLDLAEHRLPDFEDLRHDSDHVRPEGDSRAVLLDATLAATDLVIVSPLYWYSVSAHVKRYLDHWSGWLRTPGLDFKQTMAGRTLWGVTALAHEEEEVAEPLVGTLNNSAAYLGMRFGGVLLGNGSKPGDVLRDTAALTRAKTFFTEPALPPYARFPYDTDTDTDTAPGNSG